MKNLKSLFLCTLILLSLSFNFTFATEDISDTTIRIQPMSYEYLLDYGCYINYFYSDGQISISGYTETTTDVDTVYIKIYLQKYDSSKNQWITLNSASKSDNNVDYINIDKTYSVDKGYKYRVFATHKATEDSNTESANSYSDSITAN